jgi:hypothetical protein
MVLIVVTKYLNLIWNGIILILTKIIIIIIIIALIMYATHTIKGGLGQRGILGFGNVARLTAVHCSHKQNHA